MKNSGGAVQLAIVDLTLPGAFFKSLAGLQHYTPERRAYEAVLAAFERHGDADALAIDLAELGHDGESIDWHLANPGRRLEELFLLAGDLAD